VTITDNATHASGTLTFEVALKGNLTATSSSAVAAFSPDPGGPASLVLGGHTYQVSVNPGLALPAPGAPPALLGASVSVGPAAVPPVVIPAVVGGGPVGPVVQSVPEPPAFALAGVAAAALGLAGWRHRRGRVAPQAA
jgi:hypothetical protein